MRGLALGLVKYPEFHMGPFLKLVRVPLDTIPPLGVSVAPQLGITEELSAGALNPTTCITDEEMK